MVKKFKSANAAETFAQSLRHKRTSKGDSYGVTIVHKGSGWTVIYSKAGSFSINHVNL